MGGRESLSLSDGPSSLTQSLSLPTFSLFTDGRDLCPRSEKATLFLAREEEGEGVIEGSYYGAWEPFRRLGVSLLTVREAYYDFMLSI